jgi:hypothetical protein
MVARRTVLTLLLVYGNGRFVFGLGASKLLGHYLRSHSHMSDATCGAPLRQEIVAPQRFLNRSRRVCNSRK